MSSQTQRELARRFAALPRDLVREVKVGVAAERAFFSTHQAYYLPLRDWREILAG